MNRVKMTESQKPSTPVHVAPATLINVWLNGDGDISSVSKAIAQLAQEPSGTKVVIDNMEYLKEGAVIKLLGCESYCDTKMKDKAAGLIVSLTALLSNKSAKEISTIAA